MSADPDYDYWELDKKRYDRVTTRVFRRLKNPIDLHTTETWSVTYNDWVESAIQYGRLLQEGKYIKPYLYHCTRKTCKNEGCLQCKHHPFSVWNKFTNH